MLHKGIKHLSVITMALFLLMLSACGDTLVTGQPENEQSDTPAASEQANHESTDFLVVPIKEFHKRIVDTYVYRDYLYYLCYEPANNGSETERALLACLDLSQTDNLEQAEPEIIPLDIPDEQKVQMLAIDDDGTVHILTIQVDENWELLGGFWHRLDPEGRIVETTAVTEVIREHGSTVMGDFAIGKDGNAYLSSFYVGDPNFQFSIFVANREGELLFQTKTKYFIHFLFKDTEGSVYAYHNTAIQKNEGVTTHVISHVNVSAKTMDDIDISSYAAKSGQFMGLAFTTTESLLTVNMEGVYDIDLVSEETVERFTWTTLKMRPSISGRAYMLSNRRILWAEWPEGAGVGSMTAVPFRIIRPMTTADIEVAEASARERETMHVTGSVGDITLGALGWTINPMITKAIEDFNFENPHSQIEIRQYGPTHGDINEGLTELNNDIIRGNMPDLLLLPQDLSFGAYATKGLFADLNPLILSDTSFDMAEYRENIIRAYEIAGNLYGIPISFFIDTMFGKASELSGMEQWNIDDFIAFCDRYPDSMIFQYPTKTSVLDICLKANGSNLVDWASKDIGFDRNMLIKILEYTNRFINDDSFSDDRNVLDRISAGDIRLMTGVANVSRQFAMELFREPVSHIGYPTERGNGYLITSYQVVAMSSQCRHSETAWQFIRHLLSDEVQADDRHFGYPVRRANIEPMIEAAIKSEGSVGISGDGLTLSYDIQGASEEEVALFRELLEAACEIRIFDQQIDDIIKEEAAAYFNGDKPVEMVADIIENRVGVYVNELK